MKVSAAFSLRIGFVESSAVEIGGNRVDKRARIDPGAVDKDGFTQLTVDKLG